MIELASYVLYIHIARFVFLIIVVCFHDHHLNINTIK